MSISITSLENDFLRSEIKQLKSKVKESDRVLSELDMILEEMIYDFIMETCEGGLGESAESRAIAEGLVIEIRDRIKEKINK